MPMRTGSEAERLGVSHGGGPNASSSPNAVTGLASNNGATTLINPTAFASFDRTYTVAANRLGVLGRVLRVRAWGPVTPNTASPLGIRFRIGSAPFLSATSTGNVATGVNTWHAFAELVVYVTGASGFFKSSGFLVVGPQATGIVVSNLYVGGSGGSINTTAANVIEIQGLLSVSDGANQVGLDGFTVELMAPESYVVGP